MVIIVTPNTNNILRPSFVAAPCILVCKTPTFCRLCQDSPLSVGSVLPPHEFVCLPRFYGCLEIRKYEYGMASIKIMSAPYSVKIGSFVQA